MFGYYRQYSLYSELLQAELTADKQESSATRTEFRTSEICDLLWVGTSLRGYRTRTASREYQRQEELPPS